MVLMIISPYLLVVIALYLLQQKLIFLPSRLPQDYQYSFTQSFEELFIDTEDGARLNLLHFQSKNPRGIVLYFHGNAGDLSTWGNLSDVFLDQNYDVMMVDYRTYGKSTGELSETALYSDAQLVYEKVLEFYEEDNVVVYGRSLGSTFATYIASRNDPAQLILESPFYSLTHIVKQQYWFLPVDLLLRYKFPTVEFADKVKCPVIIMHGTEDEVVPYESGEKLFDAFTITDKKFISTKGGGHNDLRSFKEYSRAIEEIF